MNDLFDFRLLKQLRCNILSLFEVNGTLSFVVSVFGMRLAGRTFVLAVLGVAVLWSGCHHEETRTERFGALHRFPLPTQNYICRFKITRTGRILSSRYCLMEYVFNV
jgi:hypothetical protein